MKEEKTKKKFNKKLLTFGILGIFALALVAAGVYLYVGTSKVDVTVDEALSITSVPISISGFPGDTHTEIITIGNLAGNGLNVEVSYTELSNKFILDNTGGVCGGGSLTCEKRIVFDGEEMLLSDLSDISWEANVISGYLPHVDVFLDNGETLVFEYANVNDLVLGDYPTGYLNTFDGKGIVDGAAGAWISSGCSGGENMVWYTLSDWVEGQEGDITKCDGTSEKGYDIDGSAVISRIEIEVDNWMKGISGHQFEGIDANSEVWDVVINDVMMSNGVKYSPVLPVPSKVLIPSGGTDVSVVFEIASDTPTGKFTGVVNIERVA